jgi:hypothetical protein
MGNGRNFSLGNEFHWDPLLYRIKDVGLKAVLQLFRSCLICWADAPGIISLQFVQVAPI